MNISTYNEFIKQIENYYGLQYGNNFEIKLIQDYLKGYFNEHQLYALFDETIRVHSKKWKTLPDIAVFQEIIRDKVKPAMEVKAERAWQELLGKSSKDNVLIADPVSHTVVAGYGSWDYYCEERDNNREWTHKNFLSRYINIAELKAYSEPRVLFGWLRVNYGPSFLGVNTRIIGNVEEGKRILEQSKKSPVNGLLDFITRV